MKATKQTSWRREELEEKREQEHKSQKQKIKEKKEQEKRDKKMKRKKGRYDEGGIEETKEEKRRMMRDEGIPQKQKPSGAEGAEAGIGAGIQAEKGAGEIKGKKWVLMDISDSE